MGVSEQQFSDESEGDPYDSDDTQEDPSFDVLEETRLTFSNLSIKKKTQSRILKGANENDGEDLEVITMFVPELDEKDPKSCEIIQKIVEGGQMHKLKVDHCKMYLRKHGLRLSGNKDTLMQRIREHIDIVNDGGEQKYPASSFVLNCKGDACMGDVVMFEQNVYEVFDIASRSGNGPQRGTRVIAPPCGTRVIAGRIVKESYGAAKQQHTFTIEVLWSKGEKPLPPLHPVLIKGRNLYRLNTMRQKWEDEGKRQKILSEKHARGGAARVNKNARIQQTELQKAKTLSRVTRNELQNKKQAEKGKHAENDYEIKIHCYTKTNELNIPIQPENLHGKPNSISNAQLQAEKPYSRQPLVSLNSSFPMGPHTCLQYSSFDASKNPTRSDFHDKQYKNYATATSSILGPYQRHNGEENWRHNNHTRSPLRGQTHMNCNISSYSQQNHAYNSQRNFMAARHPSTQGQGHEQKQPCKYYAQGRCHYGERCKYLHQ